MICFVQRFPRTLKKRSVDFFRSSSNPEQGLRHCDANPDHKQASPPAVSYKQLLPNGPQFHQMISNTSNDKPRGSTSMAEWLRDWEKNWEGGTDKKSSEKNESEY